jgi:hypothetical protein
VERVIFDSQEQTATHCNTEAFMEREFGAAVGMAITTLCQLANLSINRHTCPVETADTRAAMHIKPCAA